MITSSVTRIIKFYLVPIEQEQQQQPSCNPIMTPTSAATTLPLTITAAVERTCTNLIPYNSAATRISLVE
jgi:hypothetical protein